MDGHDYEYLVAKYLRGHGYTGVKVTKGSGDFGVDVTAHRAGHKYAVQCKYYSSPVSLGAIQEAVAGKALYNCDRAMVVTNSTFTKAARELANANNVLLLENVRSAGAFRCNWRGSERGAGGSDNRRAERCGAGTGSATCLPVPAHPARLRRTVRAGQESRRKVPRRNSTARLRQTGRERATTPATPAPRTGGDVCLPADGRTRRA